MWSGILAVHLGLPFVGVIGVEKADEVVLARRALDADLAPHHMGAELAVGEVAVGKRAAMEHDRELGWDDRTFNASDRAGRIAGGDEHGRVAATVLEDLACVHPAGRPRWP